MLSDDNLVYDGALGWIDPRPENLLPSLGITARETPGAVIYTGADRRIPAPFYVPKGADFAVLRACLDDAEARAKGA